MSKPSIAESTFHEWTRNNFYRTSYGTHYTQFPQEPKNTAIPGYEGYIPFVKPENLYGDRFSAISRTALSNPKLGQFDGLSSTGFNFNPKALIDTHKDGYSHKYGCQTLVKNHPCIGNNFMETSYQGSFKRPQGLVAPTFRQTDRYLQTEKKKTKTSGFQKNHVQFDNNGWTPHENMHGDITKTEYRIQYDQEKPFHRETRLFKLRKMKAPEQNYKHT